MQFDIYVSFLDICIKKISTLFQVNFEYNVAIFPYENFISFLDKAIVFIAVVENFRRKQFNLQKTGILVIVVNVDL